VTKEFTQVDSKSKSKTSSTIVPVTSEVEEPSRKSKGDRNKDNLDEYTYSLYSEGAYYYT
jgi:hypothetical protein